MSKRIPIFIGFLLLVFAIWLQTTSVEFVRQLQYRLNDIAYDMQLRAKVFARFKAPTTPVAIIDIDDKSLRAEGRWPWSREILANLINRLYEEGAVVIATDMMFPEKETDIATLVQDALIQEKLDTPTINHALQKVFPLFNYDEKFANSFLQKDVVLGLSFMPRPFISGSLPAPLLALTTPAEKQLNFIDDPGFIGNIVNIQTAAKHAGFINDYPDADGIIRRTPLLIRYHDNLYPSLAFEAVKLYLLSNIKLITATYNNKEELEAIQLGPHVIPTDSRGQMLVPFIGKSFSFPYFSATDVLHHKLPPNILAGKIVFIGTSATGLGDLRATAVQGVYPGVEIQATIADGILEDHYSYRPAWTLGAEVSVTVVLGFILLFLFPYLGPRALITLSIIIPLTLVFANNWLWNKTGLLMFILFPILLTIALAIMNMVYGYLFETRRRERLKEMFGQYVPSKHIDEMLKASGNYGLYGEDREMTVLFADIRNFTTISEHMSAADLKNMLNQFFTPMTEIIFKYQGTIDKYIGDLIMAFWGAPLKDNKHAFHALTSALDMQNAAEKISEEFTARGWAEIRIGIGLSTGIMSVGDMGSKFRRNYTVIGDTVNLASRVEGLTKYYGVKIIVTENTQQNEPEFVFRQLDLVRVKGKKSAVAIYEVICRQSEASEALTQELALYRHALRYYLNQEWHEALELFTTLHQSHPTTKIYKIYLDRIDSYQQSPPPADWDGVFVHTSK
jgi:adenylate cyclase